MGKEVFLVLRDSCDDACEVKGYILGTEREADAYCDELNKEAKYEWQEYTWVKLDKLN